MSFISKVMSPLLSIISIVISKVIITIVVVSLLGKCVRGTT